MRDLAVFLLLAATVVALDLTPGRTVVVVCAIPFVVAGGWGCFARKGRA